MPTSAPRPCSYRGCGALVRDGSRCEQHKALHTGRFSDPSRKSRHERGYGSAWDKLRLQILERDAHTCQPCLKDGSRLHLADEVDHVIGKAEWERRYRTLDGVDDPSNLQAINAKCHRAKTQREAAGGRGDSKSSAPREGPNPQSNFRARKFLRIFQR
jgi:5-methylcytosine-specific restriction protein A